MALKTKKALREEINNYHYNQNGRKATKQEIDEYINFYFLTTLDSKWHND